MDVMASPAPAPVAAPLTGGTKTDDTQSDSGRSTLSTATAATTTGAGAPAPGRKQQLQKIKLREKPKRKESQSKAGVKINESKQKVKPLAAPQSQGSSAVEKSSLPFQSNVSKATVSTISKQSVKKPVLRSSSSKSASSSKRVSFADFPKPEVSQASKAKPTAKIAPAAALKKNSLPKIKPSSTSDGGTKKIGSTSTTKTATSKPSIRNSKTLSSSSTTTTKTRISAATSTATATTHKKKVHTPPHAHAKRKSTAGSSATSGLTKAARAAGKSGKIRLKALEIAIDKAKEALAARGRTQVVIPTQSRVRHTPPECPDLPLCTAYPGSKEWTDYWNIFDTAMQKYHREMAEFQEGMKEFSQDLDTYRREAKRIQPDEKLSSGADAMPDTSANSARFGSLSVPNLKTPGSSDNNDLNQLVFNGYTLQAKNMDAIVSSQLGRKDGIRIELNVKGIPPSLIQIARELTTLTVSVMNSKVPKYLRVGMPDGKSTNELEIYPPVYSQSIMIIDGN